MRVYYNAGSRRCLFRSSRFATIPDIPLHPSRGSTTSCFPRGKDQIITVHLSPLRPRVQTMPGKKSKKSSKAFTNLLLGIPTNIAVGPLGFQAALDVNPKGKQDRSYLGLSGDRADPAAIIDGDNPEPSRIVPRELRGSGAQDPPAQGPSTIVETRNIEEVDRPTGE